MLISGIDDADRQGRTKTGPEQFREGRLAGNGKMGSSGGVLK
jgi:hypothetical protein